MGIGELARLRPLGYGAAAFAGGGYVAVNEILWSGAGLPSRGFAEAKAGGRLRTRTADPLRVKQVL